MILTAMAPATAHSRLSSARTFSLRQRSDDDGGRGLPPSPPVRESAFRRRDAPGEGRGGAHGELRAGGERALLPSSFPQPLALALTRSLGPSPSSLTASSGQVASAAAISSSGRNPHSPSNSDTCPPPAPHRRPVIGIKTPQPMTQQQLELRALDCARTATSAGRFGLSVGLSALPSAFLPVLLPAPGVHGGECHHHH